MKSKFLDSINQIENIQQSKVLLAVSGGIDSMAMLRLFMDTDIDFSIVHCNFSLRGQESDGDELFLQDFAHKYNLQLFVKKFDTKSYAEENKLSIQMAARELRFEYFHTLSKENGFDYVALAHNLNDKVETFFINLVRGTGLKGLKGIRWQRENIIRPLLNISRKEIENYIKEKDERFREDSSNATTKYLRNKIRHDILPQFEKYEPDFLNTMSANMLRLNGAWKVYSTYIKNELAIAVEEFGKTTVVDIEKIKQSPFSNELAYELFSSYGFTLSTINDILKSLENQSGLQFYSNSHRCIKDRSKWIIARKVEASAKTYYIEKYVNSIEKPIKLEFDYFDIQPGFEIEKNSKLAQLDAEKLTFPLIIRKWKSGDYFYPLGMSGVKKLSDYFTNNKFSLLEKENAWILTSGEQIVWIIGYRIDDRFKITGHTKKALTIR